MSIPYLFRNQEGGHSLEVDEHKKRNSQQKCSGCRSLRFCLPGLCVNNINNKLSDITERRRIFRSHEFIINKGESQRYLYAIHAGCCKSYYIDDEGREHIVNFYYPGDIVGLESLFFHKYLVNIVAMNTCDICYINLNQFKAMIEVIPEIREQLLNIFSQQLWQAYSMNGSYRAKELVVQFLLNISMHSKMLGQSEHEITLPMGRQDIANYLGLSSETVSRIITQLKDSQLIKADRNNITLCDLEELHRLASNNVM